MHSHVSDDGRIITHSHPYLPSAGHGHTAMQLDQIAGFNMSAASMETSVAPLLLPQAGPVSLIASGYCFVVLPWFAATSGLRGPPVA